MQLGTVYLHSLKDLDAFLSPLLAASRVLDKGRETYLLEKYFAQFLLRATSDKLGRLQRLDTLDMPLLKLRAMYRMLLLLF